MPQRRAPAQLGASTANDSPAPTLGSVAREVGVDLSLVSWVLRGDPTARVSADKRERIVAVARQQGYRPNRVARSLRTGRTCVLGMLTPDITNPFHSVLFRGVEAAAGPAGYDTILGNTDDSQARFREIVSVLAEGHVDGLLVATAYARDEAIDWLRASGLPYQLMNRRRDDEDDPWVGPDDVQTGRLGAEHLVDLGHRRMAFLMADLRVWNHRSRLDGFRAALDAKGVELDPALVGTDLPTRAAGRDFVSSLLALPPGRRPTAIFAPQTVLSDVALMTLYRAGLRVPEDISLVGYTASADPDVTSIVASIREVGRLAATSLVARLAGEEVRDTRTMLPVRLVERGSTSPPPAGRRIRRRKSPPPI